MNKFKNKWHVLGFVITALVCIVSLLAHWIAPDVSFNANDGSEYLAKKTPLFSVDVLKIKNDVDDNTRSSFFHTLLYGKPSFYTIIPIIEPPEIDTDSLLFKIYPEYITTTLGLPLIDVVESVYPDFSRKLSYEPQSKNYIYTVDSVYFLDIKEQTQSISKKELARIFWSKHVTTKNYYLGTDKSGRDLLSRIIYAMRVSVFIAVIASLIAIAGGVLLVSIAYIFKRYKIIVLQWLESTLKNIPPILGIILLVFIVQPQDLIDLAITIGIGEIYLVFMKINRVTYSLSQVPHIQTIHYLGFSEKKVFTAHILPKVMTYLWVMFFATMAECLLYELFLSLLNLSLPYYVATLGNLIKDGLNIINESNHWHLILFPVICLTIIQFGFNTLAQNLKSKISKNPKQI